MDTPNADIRDLSFVHVFYASDTFVIPGITNYSNTTATLKDVQLIAYSNMTPNAISTGSEEDTFDSYDYNWIGLGLASGQAIVHVDAPPVNEKPYPTFAQHLINSGNIESNTYSIWLDPVANQTGHLLLGGINSFAYQDSLVHIPAMLNTTSDYYGLKLQTVLLCSIDSIAINNSLSVSNLADSNIQQVALAHSTITFLEAKVARKIWDAVGATYSNGTEIDGVVPKVPCSYLGNSSTIDIKFSGANFTLSVPISYGTFLSHHVISHHITSLPPSLYLTYRPQTPTAPSPKTKPPNQQSQKTNHPTRTQ